MATSDTLTTAIQHHQAGRLQEAERSYREILALEPNHADATYLLGTIAQQTGKYAVAAEYIERAISLKGTEAGFHSSLGAVYRALRRVPEAVACYRRALELKPDFAEAHGNLGNALKDQGKQDEAAACYQKALDLKPNLAEVNNNLGAVLKDQGKLDEAVACYRRAVQLKPDWADAHNSLGNTLRDQGKLDEAVACYARALQLKPDGTGTLSNLGNALKVQGKLDEAVVCQRRVLELKPDWAEAHYSLGNAFKEQGKLDEAVSCFRRALELKPDFADAHNNLGAALEELGDLQAAENSFRAALAHNSRFAMAHYKLAELLGGKLPEQDLLAQRRLLEEAELPDAQRLLLHFGLAQVLDARGEYAEAAQHLERGNALQLAEWRKYGQGYDPKAHESFITQMIEACTPAFFERLQSLGSESKLPVFVFGLPRSGTTLIEQILAGHSKVHGAGELRLVPQLFGAIPGVLGLSAPPLDCMPHLDSTALRRLAALHEERLRALAGQQAERIVDKLPDNYVYLGFLATVFPRAAFIHCRRDLRDVAVSCWKTIFTSVRWANDFGHIASRIHNYERLMEHWRKVAPAPLLEVDYEETVADLEGVARKLVAWCGLDWEPACLEFAKAKRPVRTASVVQVRRPVFATSVGRWKHYEQALAPLLASLEK
jgi:tetratricopeptide (TPR) repeat protein